MGRWLGVVFIFCLVCSPGFAQTTSVKGVVVDASTNKPLPFCNIFINGTTLGTTSDVEGNFEIKNVPIPRVYEIIVSYVGYESISQKADLSEETTVTLPRIRLKPSQIVLNTIEVKGTRDKEWEKKMKRFTRTFLGTDPEAEECTIMNPWVVDFPESKDRSVLLATASDPIWIENKALGYKVKFILLYFSTSAVQYTINGKTFFQELKAGTEEERSKWEKEREQSYRNSKQHLFKAIIEKRISAENIALYSEAEGSSGGRSAFFFKTLGTHVVPCDTSTMVDTTGLPKDMFRIRIPKRLEVHNIAEKDNTSIYRDMLHPISWIESKKGLIIVNKDGFEMGGSDAVTLGSMNNIRVSRLVPSDYHPASKASRPPPQIDLRYLAEKIYVQTDKPYYYEGETIWFKGYIRYAAPFLKDSLSRTVYTELISPDKKVVASKMLEIVDGSFNNQFILPDTTAGGDYYLRCYTALNINFGDDHLYTKYIPILELKQTVDPANTDTTATTNNLVRIESSKGKYNSRDQIELTLTPGDSNVQFLAGAHLSVSVTDVNQVVPLNTGKSILEGLEWNDDLPDSTVSALAHPIEYGFGFSANYKDDQPSAGRVLNVFQMQPRGYNMAERDKDGNFRVDGLSFYDSAYFAVLPVGNTKKTGATTIVAREIPPIHLPATHPKIAIKQMDLPQRTLNYKTNEVTVLKEVTVKATRIDNAKPVRRPYGMPDQVISGDDLRKNKGNLLSAIQGRFTGLQVRQMFSRQDDRALRWFVFLSRNASATRYDPQEVVVTVNDALMIGTPEEILLGINMGTVKSVELSRGVNTLYGEKSIYGILAVYVDMDQLRADEIDRSKNVLVYGYRRPAVFQYPGSTILWRPDVALDSTGTAQLKFSAAGFPGEYKIIVEGITPDGTPLRAEKTIEITDGN